MIMLQIPNKQRFALLKYALHNVSRIDLTNPTCMVPTLGGTISLHVSTAYIGPLYTMFFTAAPLDFAILAPRPKSQGLLLMNQFCLIKPLLII